MTQIHTSYEVSKRIKEFLGEEEARAYLESLPDGERGRK